MADADSALHTDWQNGCAYPVTREKSTPARHSKYGTLFCALFLCNVHLMDP